MILIEIRESVASPPPCLIPFAGSTAQENSGEGCTEDCREASAVDTSTPDIAQQSQPSTAVWEPPIPIEGSELPFPPEQEDVDYENGLQQQIGDAPPDMLFGDDSSSASSDQERVPGYDSDEDDDLLGTVAMHGCLNRLVMLGMRGTRPRQCVPRVIKCMHHAQWRVSHSPCRIRGHPCLALPYHALCVNVCLWMHLGLVLLA
jgi:hypothetical protein